MSVRPPLRRRAATLRWLVAGALAVAPLVAAPGLVGSASAAVPTSCGTSLALYGVGPTGSLTEWLDSAPTTSGGVTLAAPAVATGWSGFGTVLAAGNGVIYAVSGAGRLYWFRQTGWANGTSTWDPASGTSIGRGFSALRTMVSAGGGVLYGVFADGSLHWYRHTGWATGAVTWAPGSGVAVGSGWQVFTQLISGGFGALYGVTADGHLHWYAHDGWLTGRVAWAAGSGATIGGGWGIFTRLVSGGGGLIYGVMPDGTVRWYNHLGDVTGAVSWAPGWGAVIAGINLSGYTHLTADPTVCTGLDRTSIPAVQRAASGLLAGDGWPASQFACLSAIATRESGWVWDAGSVTGSYGIPQATAASLATAGPDWQVDPMTQVQWMLTYVVQRYGSPCQAWAFWQVHQWY